MESYLREEWPAGGATYELMLVGRIEEPVLVWVNAPPTGRNAIRLPTEVHVAYLQEKLTAADDAALVSICRWLARNGVHVLGLPAEEFLVPPVSVPPAAPVPVVGEGFDGHYTLRRLRDHSVVNEGDVAIGLEVRGGRPPINRNAPGRVIVRNGGGNSKELYPAVLGLTWTRDVQRPPR